LLVAGCSLLVAGCLLLDDRDFELKLFVFNSSFRNS
jgi:hypothetical protein